MFYDEPQDLKIQSLQYYSIMGKEPWDWELTGASGAWEQLALMRHACGVHKSKETNTQQQSPQAQLCVAALIPALVLQSLVQETKCGLSVASWRVPVQDAFMGGS